MPKWSKSEKPWERQQGESVQAFEAFDLYCRMGVDRSLRKVAQKLNKSLAIIGRWSSTWSWQKRCLEYDNELKKAELAEQRKAFRKMNERQIGTAVMMQAKAVQALDNIKEGDLRPNDILQFIREGAKLERQVRGDGAAKDAVHGQDSAGNADAGGEAALETDEIDLSVLTDLELEQLGKIVEKLAAE